MTVESFTVSDFAQDNQGKLTVVGMFDTINVASIPCMHPFMSIAARIRFMRSEIGEHTIRIEVKNPDGQDLIPPVQGQTNVQVGDTDSSVTSFVVNYGQLLFKAIGKYAVNLFVDNDNKCKLSIPLYVKKIG